MYWRSHRKEGGRWAIIALRRRWGRNQFFDLNAIERAERLDNWEVTRLWTEFVGWRCPALTAVLQNPVKKIFDEQPGGIDGRRTVILSFVEGWLRVTVVCTGIEEHLVRTRSPLDQSSGSFTQISSPVGGTRSPSRVVAEEPRRHCSGICSARRTQLSLPYISPVLSPRILQGWAGLAIGLPHCMGAGPSHVLCVSVRHRHTKACSAAFICVKPAYMWPVVMPALLDGCFRPNQPHQTWRDLGRICFSSKQDYSWEEAMPFPNRGERRNS